ncbi:MAG: hypothetical protein H6727_20260 [Myxococcales bacterium]|nr:hypothetical protein [Myxococcales bacterium]
MKTMPPPKPRKAIPRSLLLCFILILLPLSLYNAACGLHGYECREKNDCASSQICTMGWCQAAHQPVCSSDGHCPKGLYCDSGACKPKPNGCMTNNDCANNYICTGGICKEVPPTGCHKDTDCAANFQCKQGVCKPTTPTTCTRDTDCTGGKICDKNVCIEPVCQGACKECTPSISEGTVNYFVRANTTTHLFFRNANKELVEITGRIIRVRELEKNRWLAWHHSNLTSPEHASLSPNGQWLALSDEKNTELWELGKGLKATYQTSVQALHTGDDSLLMIWKKDATWYKHADQTIARKQSLDVPRADELFYNVAISPNGKEAFYIYPNENVIPPLLIDIEAGTKKKFLQQLPSTSSKLRPRYSPDGTFVVDADNFLVQYWDLQQGTWKRILRNRTSDVPHKSFYYAIHPSLHKIALYKGLTELAWLDLDTEQEEVLMPMPAEYPNSPIAIASDGRNLATVFSMDRGGDIAKKSDIFVFDLITKMPSIKPSSHSNGRDSDIAFSTTNGQRFVRITRDGVLITRDIADGSIQDLRLLAKADDDYEKTLHFFSPDAKYILRYSFHRREKMSLWDRETLQQKRTMLETDENIVEIRHAFSLNSRYLVYSYGLTSASLRFWDLTTMQETAIDIQGLGLPYNLVRKWAVSNDGRLVTGVGGDGYLYSWKLGQGNPQFIGKTNVGIQEALAFSPDGKVLAMANSSISLYDTTTWQLLKKLTPNNTPSHTLRFSPSGGYLIASGMITYLWETKTWQHVSNYDNGIPAKWMETTGQHFPQFSADGTRLLYLSGDHVHVWSCPK